MEFIKIIEKVYDASMYKVPAWQVVILIIIAGIIF